MNCPRVTAASGLNVVVHNAPRGAECYRSMVPRVGADIREADLAISHGILREVGAVKYTVSVLLLYAPRPAWILPASST